MKRVQSPALSSQRTRPYSILCPFILCTQEVALGPLHAGKRMQLEITASAVQELPEPVWHGQLSVEVYFLGLPVFKNAGSLCAHTTCPITPGSRSVRVQSEQMLPGWAPHGAYSLR